MKHRVSMLALVEDYLTHKRNMGFRFYGEEAWEISNFGRYADKIDHRGPISTSLAIRWAKQPQIKSSIRCARRLDAVRKFAQYRVAFDPATEVPPKGIFGSSRYPRKAPHIYTDQEIASLLDATSRIRSKNGLRPQVYITLFGILACTGLRVSEAMTLTDEDVDFRQGVLRIRGTKFHKTRLVPLHPSAVSALRRYVKLRDRCLPRKIPETFLVNEDNKPLTKARVSSRFQLLRKKMRWTADGRTRVPRIHDFRHTFAVRRLLSWYQEGDNIDQKITFLATYLGHVNVTKTYWYLTAVPELMAVVGGQFEKFTRSKSEGAS